MALCDLVGNHALAGLQDFIGTLVGSAEPGLAVGVYVDGELVRAATAGCAVIEHAVPVTEHTAFDIASVSKHMTSTCLLLLASDGLVDLDGDIRVHLPELALTQPVTLRQCLTHTAGLRDYFTLCDIAGLPVLGIREDRFMDLVAGQADVDFPPGPAFCYSNTGYALAAALVRRLTGDGLARFASKRVFGPLGMAATHFRDDVSLVVPGLANGYLADQAGFRRCDVTEEVVGDGAIVTTLADLAAWHSFMVTGAVLGTNIRDGLLARQVLTDGTELGYALGLESIDVNGVAAWWHSGSWAGYRAAVIYLPWHRAGVTVLANRDDHYASHVAFAAASVLVSGEDLRSRYQALSGIPASPDTAKQEAAAIAGLWHEPDEDVFVQLDATGGQLMLTARAGHRFLLGTDGSWHGIGPAAGSRYTMLAGTLTARWGLSPRPDGRYERAQRRDRSPAPVGIFRNEELRAYADLMADESGAVQIVIGLAAPRQLTAVGDGVWRAVGGEASADPVTVRMAGNDLLISAPGARHVRFDLVADAPADRGIMRGLSGAR